MANATANSLEDEIIEASRNSSLEEIALIEERVDSGLSELLESYKAPYDYAKLPLDGISGRFSIDMARPLPQFDSGGAKAYSASCLFATNKPVYALVCDPRVPYQMTAISKMRNVSHPNLQTLYDAETIRLSYIDEARLVLFMDQPVGTRLSDLLANGTTYHESTIVYNFLAPVMEAVNLLYEQGIHHGRISPSHMYINDNKLMLGECLSEPNGLSQDYLYEPIERLQADGNGKGDAYDKSDAYAMGMLAYELQYGLDRFRAVDKGTYIRSILEFGAYHLLTSNKEISEGLTDFFRGLLCEDRDERWDLNHVRNWLTGKRYHLIHPSLPKEATRPFSFANQEYINFRALAQGIQRNWPRAGKELRTSKLDRWLEMSAHNKEMAERAERIIRSTGGETATSLKLNNELTARIITLLDPSGPIRMDNIALHVDGIGSSIAHYMRNGMHQELNWLVEIINYDLPNFWSDLAGEDKSYEISNVLWKLQNVRQHIQQPAIGFGMERAMYMLNPSLPCMSELLRRYHVTTLEDALLVLDSLAQSKARDTSLLDRHLAAFLASKLEMNKEVKFRHLSHLPALRDHPELQVLHIITQAQERLEKQKLIGLSTWIAMRVEKLADNIHNRTARRKLLETLRRAAATGKSSHVLATLVESDLARDDLMGFSRAANVYGRNLGRLHMLENPKTVQRMARDLGGRISVFVGYLILSVTVYVLLDQYYL